MSCNYSSMPLFQWWFSLTTIGVRAWMNDEIPQQKHGCNYLSSPKQLFFVNKRDPGGWFNKKMTSYQYSKSYCGDKTFLRLSYLHNGISYTGKTASLYCIRGPGIVLGGNVSDICNREQVLTKGLWLAVLWRGYINSIYNLAQYCCSGSPLILAMLDFPDMNMKYVSFSIIYQHWAA